LARSRRAHPSHWLTRHAVRLAREMQEGPDGRPAEVIDLELVHAVMALLADRVDTERSGTPSSSAR
jgi:hypothetical protein